MKHIESRSFTREETPLMHRQMQGSNSEQSPQRVTGRRRNLHKGAKAQVATEYKLMQETWLCPQRAGIVTRSKKEKKIA